MTIVVIPKTVAECNQLISVLHSQARKLWATCEDDAPITVGKVVICWDFDNNYAVRPVSNPVIIMDAADHLTANELYERLSRV